ncbi:hypothetical protein [Paenibacillus lutrae]|uniref:Uncharacterized protein n=1 Tax=Paenibacillus lutrae TaxID=2078573 RepID=A0A7X3JZC9_9BACL|nr:hypothetical protein [Paenibacillus lutrae]MVO99825.1 hypothetical protein [Paenibacillus lutrae]
MTLRLFQWFDKWSYPSGLIRKLLYSIVVSTVIAALILSFLLNRLVPGSMSYGELSVQTVPASFYLPDTGNYVTDPDLITAFTSTAGTKQASRKPEAAISAALIQTQTQKPLRITYNGTRGKSVLIDAQGRIYMPVSKTEIKSRSGLHWLWWKLDPGKSDTLYYVTDPDPAVANLAGRMAATSGPRS